MSPNALSLELLRKQGWEPEVVERWIPGAKIRKDLWGFADILATRPGAILAVQATTYSNVSARVHKIKDSPLYPGVLAAGVLVEVWGWWKVRNRWTVRVVSLSKVNATCTMSADLTLTKEGQQSVAVPEQDAV